MVHSNILQEGLPEIEITTDMVETKLSKLNINNVQDWMESIQSYYLSLEV